MLSVGRRTAGVDHAKLRELLLVTSRTCNLLRFVNERIIAKSLADADYSSKVGLWRGFPQGVTLLRVTRTESNSALGITQEQVYS
jgi:hypothetical protein